MSNDYQLPKTLSAFIERLYQAYCCLRGSKPNSKTFNLFFGCMTFGQLNLSGDQKILDQFNLCISQEYFGVPLIITPNSDFPVDRKPPG